jgi:hypothetical protein
VRALASAVVALLMSCGARRAPPEPAFPGPLAVEVAALAWTEAGLQASLRVRNSSPFSLSVEALDWSAASAEVTGQVVGHTLAPGASVDLPLLHPGPPPSVAGPLQIAGTVHTRAAGGIRRAEVFRAAAPPSSTEIP